MRRQRWVIFSAVLMLILAACSSSSASPSTGGEASDEPRASEAAPTEAAQESGFKDGDTVTLMVPTSPGGGYDTQARIMQPYLEEALREETGADVTVVVQNVEGAQQRSGLEELYRADPDGLLFALFSGNITAGHQVFSGAEYDLRELTALAAFPASNRAMAVRKDLDLPELTLEALVEQSQQEPVLVAHPGLEPDWKIMAAILADNGWDLNADLVAVNGTSETMAALLRGDVQVGWSTASSVRKFVDDNTNDLVMLSSTGCEEDPADPGTLLITDEGVPEADLICSTVGSGTRFIMGPPGIPDATTQALRNALEAAMSNPDHLAQATDAGYDSSYRDYEYVEQAVNDVINTFEKYQDAVTGS